MVADDRRTKGVDEVDLVGRMDSSSSGHELHVGALLSEAKKQMTNADAGRMVGTAAAGGVAALAMLYRRDLVRAQARLAGFRRRVVETPVGAIEYGELGVGPPVFVVLGFLGQALRVSGGP